MLGGLQLAVYMLLLFVALLQFRLQSGLNLDEPCLLAMQIDSGLSHALGLPGGIHNGISALVLCRTDAAASSAAF